MYEILASGGSTATQQTFIDAYYGLLATVGGPYPACVFCRNNDIQLKLYAGIRM
jgi:hypothetical protein